MQLFAVDNALFVINHDALPPIEMLERASIMLESAKEISNTIDDRVSAHAYAITSLIAMAKLVVDVSVSRIISDKNH